MAFHQEIKEEIIELTTGNDEVKICMVCGAIPGVKVYGAIACHSCKIFFLRACTVGALPRCQNEKLCLAFDFRVQFGKPRCAACRYEKCLNAGMLPTMTARRSGCKLREQRAHIGLKGRGKSSVQQVEVCPQSAVASQSITAEHQIAARLHAQPHHLIDQADSFTIIKALVSLQQVLLNDDPNKLLNYDFTYCLDVSISDALQNPAIVCPRVPIQWDPATAPPIPKEHMPTLAGRLYARGFVYVLDWVRAIPEFWEIDVEDRIVLISTNFNILWVLTLYYYSYSMGFENGVLSAFGTYRQASESMGERGFSQSLYRNQSYNLHMAFGVNFFMPLLKKAEMKDEEFCLMKNIVFFSTTLGLQEKSVNVARKAFNKYSWLLMQHLITRFGNEAITVQRFSDLMAIPVHLQQFRQKAFAEMGRVVLVKEGGIDGTLPEEILRRSL